MISGEIRAKIIRADTKAQLEFAIGSFLEVNSEELVHANLIGENTILLIYRGWKHDPTKS